MDAEKGSIREREIKRNKPNLEKFSSIWPLFGIHFQSFGQVVTEHGRQVLRIGDGRRAIRSNEIQGFERILIKVWWLSFDHFCKVYIVRLKRILDIVGYVPIAMMPRLQISTFGPYSLRVTTSGAIQ
jgi:hypothetical protein